MTPLDGSGIANLTRHHAEVSDKEGRNGFTPQGLASRVVHSGGQLTPVESEDLEEVRRSLKASAFDMSVRLHPRRALT